MKIKILIITKKELLLLIQLLISAIILLTIIISLVLLSTAKDEFYHSEFIQHGSKYAPFFFSFWAIAAEITCFLLYTALGITDFYSIKLRKWEDRLQSIASYLLFAIVFPLSLTVLLLFWGFYFYNKETIFPEQLQTTLGNKINHMYHTFPPIIAVFFMASSNKKTPLKSRTFSGLGAVLVLYLICILLIKLWYAKWVYLALEEFSPLQLVLFITFTLLISIMCHQLGFIINDFLIGLHQMGVWKAFDKGVRIWIPTL